MTNYEITMSKLSETKIEAQKVIDRMNKAILAGRRVEQCAAVISQMEVVIAFTGTDDDAIMLNIGDMATEILHKSMGWECAEPKKFYRAITGLGV